MVGRGVRVRGIFEGGMDVLVWWGGWCGDCVRLRDFLVSSSQSLWHRWKGLHKGEDSGMFSYRNVLERNLGEKKDASIQ